jgi:hypothetical protein
MDAGRACDTSVVDVLHKQRRRGARVASGIEIRIVDVVTTT